MNAIYASIEKNLANLDDAKQEDVLAELQAAFASQQAAIVMQKSGLSVEDNGKSSPDMQNLGRGNSNGVELS